LYNSVSTRPGGYTKRNEGRVKARVMNNPSILNPSRDIRRRKRKCKGQQRNKASVLLYEGARTGHKGQELDTATYTTRKLTLHLGKKERKGEKDRQG